MNYDYKNIWRISAPIIVSMILTQLIGITDVIYLGRVGTTALGAAGLGSTYFFAFFVLVEKFGRYTVDCGGCFCNSGRHNYW